MPFEWDEAKRLKTLKERGFDFADAAGLFDGRPVLNGRSPFDKEVRFVGRPAAGQVLHRRLDMARRESADHFA